MTVKELKKYLENIDDNLKIFLSDSDEGIQHLSFYHLHVINTSCDSLGTYLKIG